MGHRGRRGAVSIGLLHGIVPTEIKRVTTGDILIQGCHIDSFNGVYSLSPTPTTNGSGWAMPNGDNNYLHTTSAGHRLYADFNTTQWILAAHVPSPVTGLWSYQTLADYYYVLTSDWSAFPPVITSVSIGGTLALGVGVIPNTPGRVEIVRAQNMAFNGIYTEEGAYNGRPYYRRGNTNYGIIYTDELSFDCANPGSNAIPYEVWAIVDDLPAAPVSQYYYMEVAGCYSNGYQASNSQADPVGITGWTPHGSGGDINITITEVSA